MATSDYCLKWNDHHNVFFSTAEELCASNILCDVSLSAGEKIFQAHKLVLSVCSPYFKRVFAINDRSLNTVIHMKNVDPRHLELILAYMYRGELTLQQTELVQFLATAKDLQIKGLSEMDQVDASVDIKREYRNDEHEAVNLKRKPENLISEHKLPKQLKSAYVPSPPPLLLNHRPSPLHPALVDSPVPSPPTSQPLHPLKGDEENGGVRKLMEKGRVGGGGEERALMVDEHVIPEDDDLSNLSMTDVQHIKYEDSDSQDLSKQSTAVLPGGVPNNGKTKRPPPSVGGGGVGPQGGVKPFPCGMCDMSFDQKWLLKRHYRTHTKERPFRCMLCMKNFSLKDSCIRHIRNVHRGEIYGDATVSDISSSYCQYDEVGGGQDKDDLETEMASNEALAVAL